MTLFWETLNNLPGISDAQNISSVSDLTNIMIQRINSMFNENQDVDTQRCPINHHYNFPLQHNHSKAFTWMLSRLTLDLPIYVLKYTVLGK